MLVNVFGGLYIEGFAAALRYIAEIADQENKPCVVNISAGITWGAHDGSDELESEAERFMTPTPGTKTRVVVKSAGNEAQARRHARATIDEQQTATFAFEIKEGENQNCEVGFWYRADATLSLELIVAGHSFGVLVQGAPNAGLNLVPVNPSAPPTSSRQPASSGTRIRWPSMPSISAVNDSAERRRRAVPGPWHLRVTNTGTAAVAVDAWVDRFVGDVRFPRPGGPGDNVKATDLGTITIPVPPSVWSQSPTTTAQHGCHRNRSKSSRAWAQPGSW
ncbi:MAG: hypothetical protein IPL61_36465 [Myxococcales bacterium]|nr:hypothetical protein [Myxococcales bacterium]